ncbi:MAG: hypothetical protein HGA78_09190 [Nitrospirales bacterium]|nr:hypothetical protein [Nitrospirales bacterium]
MHDARRHRERGWQLIRLAWLEGGATDLEINAYSHGESLERAYERSVTRADETVDRLRREAERVARKATWLADLKRLEGEAARLDEEHKDQRAKAEALSAEWKRLWEGMGIVPLSPREMKAWAERQEALAERSRKIRISRTGLSCLEERIGKLRDTLSGSISFLGESCREAETLRTLLRVGQELLERLEKEQAGRESLQKRIAEIGAELSAAQQEERLLSAELAGVMSVWTEALKPLGLDGSATPVVGLALLNRNKEFFVKFDQITGLSRRIDGIVRDSDLFAAEVRQFCSVVAPDMLELPVEISAAELHERLARAQKDSAKRNVLTKKYHDAVKDFQEARERVSETEDRLAAMFRRAGCSTEEEVMEKERRSAEALILDDRIGSFHERLLGYASGGTVEALIIEASGADADSLPGEISRTDQRIGELEAEISGLDQTIGSERREIERMDGSADAAAAAERGQEVLAGLREEAERYIRLRMASVLLRSEMEKYRAENQGPILRRASELFSVLTIGSFSGLKTEYTDDDRPVLAGIRSDGRAVRAEGLSEGTCDQLYLALRLASLEKHLSTSEPLPFILDDILIQFDDGRSKAVLQALEQLSTRTQVILFTHHSHIVELAGAVISPQALQVSTLQA